MEKILAPSSHKSNEVQTLEKKGELSNLSIKQLEADPSDQTHALLAKVSEEIQTPRELLFDAFDLTQEYLEIEQELQVLMEELNLDQMQEEAVDTLKLPLSGDTAKKELQNEPPVKPHQIKHQPERNQVISEGQAPKIASTPPLLTPTQVRHLLFSERKNQYQLYKETKTESKIVAASLETSHSRTTQDEQRPQNKEQREGEHRDATKDDPRDHKKKQQEIPLEQNGLNKKSNKRGVERKISVQRAHSTADTDSPMMGISNIYVRYMNLMARILGQAEAEAHELYQRIKLRTDNIDLLTNLIGKINAESGKIDWSNNTEMKEMLQKAREIGVTIPEGKFTWTEDEKRLLKENIQMQKDSLEKVTQLERTDMQRHLQEASQCHQMRSNILKLLKEVVDTIVANIRP